MHLHPDLAALRSDDAPQRQAQAALFAAVADWRGAVAEVTAALEAFGGGEQIDRCGALHALMSDAARARAFAASFAARISRALAAAPLGQVPLRHFTDGTVSTLLLARSGRAALFLTAVDGEALASQPAPRSVSFAATESRELILAGSARAELVSDGLACTPLALTPGLSVTRDCAREAMILREVRGVLVSLRLQRRRAQAGPTREVELASGRLVHQSAPDAGQSRKELMIALLGRMERADAAPVLAEIAKEPGADSLRWQALRECLGLDTAAGFAALSRIAGTHGDPLVGPAAALRERLVAAHPQLAEAEPCLA